MIKKKPYVLNKNVLIGEILKDCPKVVEYLAEYGLVCINCPLNQFETLEAGARVHGMNNKAIEKMIKEVNARLRK